MIATSALVRLAMALALYVPPASLPRQKLTLRRFYPHSKGKPPKIVILGETDDPAPMAPFLHHSEGWGPKAVLSYPIFEIGDRVEWDEESRITTGTVTGHPDGMPGVLPGFGDRSLSNYILTIMPEDGTKVRFKRVANVRPLNAIVQLASLVR